MWVTVRSLPNSHSLPQPVSSSIRGAMDPSPVSFADWFPLPESCDNLWKVMADRAIVSIISAEL